MNNNLPTYPTKYLFLFAMIYANVNIASTVLVYKIVSIDSVVITAGALLSPLWYLLGDLIAEVYGYNQARKVIWTGLACELMFITICVTLIKLPSPLYWHSQASYDAVFNPLPRVYIGSVIGTLSGAFINVYLISKWKIMVKGKYFWLRSVTCNAFGQLVFSITTAFTDLFGVIPMPDLWKIIFVSYSTKMCILPFLAVPISIVVIYVKKLEGMDYYENKSHFNPFVSLSYSNR